MRDDHEKSLQSVLHRLRALETTRATDTATIAETTAKAKRKVSNLKHDKLLQRKRKSCTFKNLTTHSLMFQECPTCVVACNVQAEAKQVAVCFIHHWDQDFYHVLPTPGLLRRVAMHALNLSGLHGHVAYESLKSDILNWLTVTRTNLLRDCRNSFRATTCFPTSKQWTQIENGAVEKAKYVDDVQQWIHSKFFMHYMLVTLPWPICVTHACAIFHSCTFLAFSYHGRKRA